MDRSPQRDSTVTTIITETVDGPIEEISDVSLF